MTEKQLRELIKQGEGQTLDFKDPRIYPRSLAETLAAFAAADGGVALIGVSNDGEIIGVSDFDKLRDNVIYEAAGRSHCDPQIRPLELERVKTKDGKLVVADEPTGSLDHANAVSLVQLLKELNQKETVTLIMVTHSLELASQMSRVLELRDCKLVEKF